MKVLPKKKLTYEDYLALPETKQRYEIIDGELIWMSPAPTTKHQEIVGALYLKLAPLVKEHDLGKIFLSPVDVVVSRQPLRTRQPDLLFVRKDRLHIVQDRIERAPDLVIEILSPGNTRAAVQAKLDDYAHLGVRECWLVSLEAITIEVLMRARGRYKRLGLFGSGDKIKSGVWPPLSLTVDDLLG